MLKYEFFLPKFCQSTFGLRTSSLNRLFYVIKGHVIVFKELGHLVFSLFPHIRLGFGCFVCSLSAHAHSAFFPFPATFSVGTSKSFWSLDTITSLYPLNCSF